MQPVIDITSHQELDASDEHHLQRYSALALSSLICVPFAIRAAIKLGVFEIIAEAGPDAYLSPAEIADKIPTNNANKARALERILRMLVTNSILKTTRRAGDGEGQKPQVTYGLGKLGEYLVAGPPGTSIAPLQQLAVDKVIINCLYHLEDAILDPDCEPFVKAHGKSLFEYLGEDLRFNKVFHEAMRSGSVIATNVIFDKYKGFEDAKEIVDVGGGTGAAVAEIVGKYPYIRGRNFDLPYVIANALKFPGVEHVAGNMFESVPYSETIFMKYILHDWDDDQCVEILKNCWKALPVGGKVIDVDLVVPTKIENGVKSLRVLALDLHVMACCPRGRERTIEEYQYLGKAAGFAQVKGFPVANDLHVIEFHKRLQPEK
ncbi:(S)-scoulerine 9-O-methyltransferase-like [Aristolochia californica]|uniref:(S)-scoulerine 9-O-methyltransferase-like n=1 Tax=Aristolochia californica TaxID=171875 RepID=UPI0035DBEECD